MLYLIILIFTSSIINIRADYNGTFWHICDIHLNISFKSNGNDIYGNYNDDSAFPLVQSSFNHMRNVHPNPDFIIVNGDNGYHGQISDAQLNSSIYNVTKELKLYFPSTIVLPSLGNHDINPANMIGENSTWCPYFYEFWKDFFQNVTISDINTLKKGCFYSYSHSSQNLMVIVLNTCLWYNVNTYVKTLLDPLNQFEWFEQKLKNAKTNNFTVFIVAHVPPGASEYSPQLFKHFHPHFNERFLQIVLNYSDIIDAGFFAHQHTDAFKIVYNNKDEPVIPLLLSPSITPYNLWNLGSINPSVRLYIWNGTSDKSKYLQYHTQIPQNINDLKNRSLLWSLEYNSTDLSSSLSAKSLDNLVNDFVRPSSVYFSSFFIYHLSGRQHDNRGCSVYSMCRCRMVCGIKNINYTKLQSCLDHCPFKEPVNLVVILVPLVFFILIIVLGFVFYRILIKRRNSRYDSL